LKFFNYADFKKISPGRRVCKHTYTRS